MQKPLFFDGFANEYVVAGMARCLSDQASETVHTPWGMWRLLGKSKATESIVKQHCCQNSDAKFKLLTVFPGKRTSLQKHEHRNELWIVLQGSPRVEVMHNRHLFLDSEISPGSFVGIPSGYLHRVSNRQESGDVLIAELQYGTVCSEDDIIRVEDDFGRAHGEIIHEQDIDSDCGGNSCFVC